VKGVSRSVVLAPQVRWCVRTAHVRGVSTVLSTALPPRYESEPCAGGRHAPGGLTALPYAAARATAAGADASPRATRLSHSSRLRTAQAWNSWHCAAASPTRREERQPW